MEAMLASWMVRALPSAGFAALQLGPAAQVAPVDKLSVVLVA